MQHYLGEEAPKDKDKGKNETEQLGNPIPRAIQRSTSLRCATRITFATCLLSSRKHTAR